MERQFRWLLDSSVPRKGPPLKKLELHNTKDYPKHVVDEWVRSGAAEYVKDSPKSKKEEKG